jgi:hypothetical protein
VTGSFASWTDFTYLQDGALKQALSHLGRPGRAKLDDDNCLSWRVPRRTPHSNKHNGIIAYFERGGGLCLERLARGVRGAIVRGPIW